MQDRHGTKLLTFKLLFGSCYHNKSPSFFYGHRQLLKKGVKSLSKSQSKVIGRDPQLSLPRFTLHQWHHIKHYLQASSTNWQPQTPTEYIATLWTEVLFCLFKNSSFTYKGKLQLHDCPSQSSSSMGFQAQNYISQALDCSKMYSKVVHWVSMPLVHREKAATFKVRPKAQKALELPKQRKPQASSACISKSYNSCYILYMDKLAVGTSIYTQTHAAGPLCNATVRWLQAKLIEVDSKWNTEKPANKYDYFTLMAKPIQRCGNEQNEVETMICH